MITIEFGKENSDVIILLHGGGLSWWNYKEVGELLKEKYHVIIPILDGHAGSDKDFLSIEKNANEMIDYINEFHNGSVKFIGGVSLGGQILVEMLTQRNRICQYALIESALVIPMKITNLLLKPMMDMSFGFIKQQWFSKLQFKSLRIKNELYELYYRDTCKITKENMIAFLKSNASYAIKKEVERTSTKVHIFVGEKEPSKMIRSAHLLHKTISDSRLEVMKKRYHGEFSINYAEEYAKKVVEILENRNLTNESR